MRDEILYLDNSVDKTVIKAIRKYGIVSHARDINEAAELIVKKEFDYCFLDADTLCLRELLTHLEHDPYFVQPKAFVLLTNNEVEDCDAWNVDAYITRRRIKEDLPYVLSHYNRRTSDYSSVLKLITVQGSRPGAEAASKRELSDETNCSQPVAASDKYDDYESGKTTETDLPGTLQFLKTDGDPNTGEDAAGSITASDSESLNAEDIDRDLPGEPASFVTSSGGERFSGPNEPTVTIGAAQGGRNRRFSSKATMTHPRKRFLLAGLLVAAFCALLYFAIPMGFSESGDKNKLEGAGSGAKASKKSQSEDKKENPDGLIYENYQETNAGSAINSGLTEENSEVQPVGTELSTGDTVPDSSSPVPSTYSSPSPDTTPPPTSNNPPSVNISGPTQVYIRQTATYTASASDPDGDSVSYSWGSTSKSMSWSTPGHYTVTVTVTDSRGASKTASISVRVI